MGLWARRISVPQLTWNLSAALVAARAANASMDMLDVLDDARSYAAHRNVIGLRCPFVL